MERFEEARAGMPSSAEGWNGRGIALSKLGRFAEALENFDKALALRLDYAEALNNRGNALRNLNRLDEAMASYDAALAIKPDYASAFYNRGTTLVELKRSAEALTSFDGALKINPGMAQAWNNRGNALRVLKRYEEALVSYDKALAIIPGVAQAWFNRGEILVSLNRFEEALASYDKALAIMPGMTEGWSSRGVALSDLKRFAESLASYDRALAINPDYAAAHTSKGLCLLLLGRFDQGWREYEWRKKLPQPVGAFDCSAPAWTGAEPLNGKTLFIYAEQGLGDTIWFCRFVPLAEARGAKAIFAVQDSLKDLMKGLSPTIEIVGLNLPASPVDYCCSLMSLPSAFKIYLENIPDKVPYLHLEKEQIESWKARVGNHGFRIGVCWRGSNQGAESRKSFPLAALREIAKIPNVRLISLQKYDGVEELRDLPPGMKVETLWDNDDAGSFVDTAAVMENLDLVITTDTSIAHMAGALARPTWVPLKYVPAWHWLLDRDDSPWYPTMRLFRQSSQDDWRSVFAAMESELTKVVRSPEGVLMGR